MTSKFDPNGIARYWDRHLPSCTGFSRTGKRCSKCNGSENMMQRNAYAARVAAAMEPNGECPTCDNVLTFGRGGAEVDRIDPSLGYVPGNVVYRCSACNGERGILQSQGRDEVGIEAIRAAVVAASLTVEVPSMNEARAWHAAQSAPKPRRRKFAS